MGGFQGLGASYHIPNKHSGSWGCEEWVHKKIYYVKKCCETEESYKRNYQKQYYQANKNKEKETEKKRLYRYTLKMDWLNRIDLSFFD